MGRPRDDSQDGGRGGRGGGGGRDGAGPDQDRKLFVGQLAYGANEDHLRRAFQSSGEIVSVQIIKDKETGDSRGFGFVTYAELADAEAALRKLNGVEIAGRACRLAPAGGKGDKGDGRGGGGGGGGGRFDRDRDRDRSRDRGKGGGYRDGGRDGGRGRDGGGDRGGGGKGGGKSHEPNKLFIGRLSPEVTEADVEDVFRRDFDILNVQIVTDKDTGRSKGFGFVKFNDSRDAEDCLRKLDGAQIQGKPCRLERIAAKMISMPEVVEEEIAVDDQCAVCAVVHARIAARVVRSLGVEVLFLVVDDRHPETTTAGLHRAVDKVTSTEMVLVVEAVGLIVVSAVRFEGADVYPLVALL